MFEPKEIEMTHRRVVTRLAVGLTLALAALSEAGLMTQPPH